MTIDDGRWTMRPYRLSSIVHRRSVLHLMREVQAMSTPFYSYDNRQGVLPISWDDFFSLCKGLALAVAPYQPEIILGVARGGLYPATLLSHLLQAELYP